MMQSHPTIVTATLSCVSMAALPLGLAACDKLTPNGASSTMTLLHGGSEKVCVAPDVQRAVRNIIVPRTIDGVASEVTQEDKTAAIDTVSVSFDLTTLLEFDKAVGRATCNANVKISGQGDQANSFEVTFTVSPSADDPSTFIATAAAPDAEHYARNLILTAISNATATRQAQQQQAAQQQAKARVLAVANPKWLLGSWLPVDLESYGCDKGYEFVFFPRHSFEAYQIAGLWMLDADKLHIDARGTNDSLNLTGLITAADSTSFTLIDTTGKTIIFHRCRDDRPTVIESMNSIEGMDIVTPEEAAQATSGR